MLQYQWQWALLLALSTGTGAAHHRVSLAQHPGDSDAKANAQYAVAKHGNTGGYAVLPEMLHPNGFWFGQFDIGNTKNATLLIDTGSSDVALNPGLYKPSAASQNLHKTGRLGYGTTEEDGCGQALVNYTVYADTMSAQGLAVQNYTFANVIKVPPPNKGTITKFPGQGIVGLAGTSNEDTGLGSPPFFQALCDQKQVNECRFGMAYGTSGKGAQVFGGVDTSLFNGNLSVSPLYRQGEWELKGSVAINGTRMATNQYFILDSGTANIVGPPKQVIALFKKLGMQYQTLHLPGCTSVVFGYYPCDKPPTVGYRFPSGASSTAAPVYNIEPSAFKQADNGNNNCTSIITGIDLFGEGMWILGQAWFQGKYVDFNDAGVSVGIAELKDKAFASS